MDNNQTNESSIDKESIDNFKERIKHLNLNERNLELKKMLNKIKDTRNKSKVEKINSQIYEYTTIKYSMRIICFLFIIFGFLSLPVAFFFDGLRGGLYVSVCIMIPIIITIIILPLIFKPNIVIECPRCKTLIRYYETKRPINVQCHICKKNIVLEED